MSDGAQMVLYGIGYWLLTGLCLAAMLFLGAGPLPFVAGFLAIGGVAWLVSGLFVLAR